MMQPRAAQLGRVVRMTARPQFFCRRKFRGASTIDLHYLVVGIRRDGTRDARYRNLSLQTAEQVRMAMVQAGLYRQVVIEDQSLLRLSATQQLATRRPAV